MAATGTDRRAYLRTRVAIPAAMSGTGVADRDVTISDVSQGGLYLAVGVTPQEVQAPLGAVIGRDGRVQIRCRLLDGRMTAIDGLVARITVHGVGMAFVRQEPELVRALMAHAGAPASAIVIGDAATRTEDPPHQRNGAAIDLIKDKVAAWLPGRIKAFTDQAEARLVARASKSLSNAEQTPFFDAIAELQRRRAGFEPTMAESLQSRLDQIGDTIAGSGTPDLSSSTGELALVDLDDFEIFLSVASMATKAVNRNDLALYALGRRLSTLAGVVIDNTNNPLAPSSLCDPFHEGMGDAPMVPDALGVIYRSFDDFVMGDLSTLYASVLEALESAGVQMVSEPEPEAPVESQRTTPKQPPPQPEIDVNRLSESEMLRVPNMPRPFDPGASGNFGTSRDHGSSQDLGPSLYGGAPFASGSADGGHASPSNYGAPPSADFWGAPQADEPVWTPGQAGTSGQSGTLGQALPPASDTSGATSGGHGPATSSGRGNSPSGNYSAPVGALPANFQMPAVPGTAFGTAQNMMGWSRALGGGFGRGRVPRFGANGALLSGGLDPSGGIGGASLAGVEPAATITVEQLFQILSQIQAGVPFGGSDGGGGASGGGPGSAATGESGVSSFRARLLDALGSDADGPKAISGQLGDAVELIMGLFEAFRQDDEVGPELATRLDGLEPAVHKVALLDQTFFEAPGHPARQLINQLARLEPSLNDGAAIDFWETIDNLLGPLIQGFEHDLGLFGDVLREVDELVERQVATYRANVASVVASCDAQQAFVQARRGAQAPAPAGDRGVLKEWAVWLNRTARLEPGETVELSNAHGMAPDRLVLAWIADRLASFVFVDRRGQKTSSLSRQEFAMLLRRGSARIVRTNDTPLVERALNHVLQNLHGLLERRATRDLRTGLLNRKALLARLRDALMQAPIDGQGVGVLGFEIVEYSKVESRLGEEAAESLLRRIAQQVSSTLDGSATMACTGVSTIVALIGNTTAEMANRMADLVCQAVSGLRIRWGEETFSPTVRASVGVVVPGEDPVDALEAVEINLASHSGVGRVASEVLAPEIRAGSPGTMDYETLIAKTLGSDRLQLRCHRIAPLGDEARPRSHFEVLLGIRDGDEPIPAADFVRAAEQNDQMPAVDRWVIRNTLRWMAEKRRWLRKVSGFAINLSGPSVSDPNLVEFVLEQLSQSGVPPGKVIFEITETAAVDNMRQAQNFLRTLSEVGCRFALADFGSRQSSYGYLKQLPVDYVKIDGMFVRDLETDDTDLAVVRSVNEIAHFMGKKTVAEFVQSAAIVTRLRQVGVDYGQGYFIEMPMYLEEVTEEGLATPAKSLEEVPHETMGEPDGVVEATLGL
jgi:diguanylate cyclase (GGDEF)-like protein